MDDQKHVTTMNELKISKKIMPLKNEESSSYNKKKDSDVITKEIGINYRNVKRESLPLLND
jgi:hypothetical protein